MWISRDKDGRLWLCSAKPVENQGAWNIDESKASKYFFDDDEPSYYIRLDSTAFPEVTFENSPVELKLNLNI